MELEIEFIKPPNNRFEPIACAQAQPERWGTINMENKITPCRGKGPFQWNKGGLLGVQIGSTAYTLIIGLIILFDSPTDGIPIVLCGLIPNLLGYFLWKQRDRIEPYVAIQALTLGVFIFATLFFAFIIWGADPQIARKYFSGCEKAGWVLLVFPLMMLYFWNIERIGKKRPQPTNAPYSSPAAGSKR
ncbi:MAG: hypothetical protein PHW60_12495 [Kiritimatiellae bacterium]|nr:hypothetical protein [Kiritimatiellia bacterium]